MSNLSENLLMLRKNHGFTQEDLATKVFVTRQAVSKWECGESTPDLETLVALSEMYSVSIDELVKTKIVVQNEIQKIDNYSNAEQLKQLHKHKTFITMLIWALGSLSIYALICGIIQTATINLTSKIWLIWFTLPIVPPIIFAIRFRHEIGKAYLLYFFDVPFVCGIIFQLIVYAGNTGGAWIAFLAIPLYYLIAILVTFKYKKNRNKNSKVYN